MVTVTTGANKLLNMHNVCYFIYRLRTYLLFHPGSGFISSLKLKS